MKSLKLIWMTMIMAFFAAGANAQGHKRVLVVDGGDYYKSHFTLQPQIGWGYTLGEHSFGGLMSPSFAINAGYGFNPWMSARLGMSGWQAKGNAKYDYADHLYRFNYLQFNLDGVVSVTDLVYGWNPKRLFDGYAFIGIGANDRFNNSEAEDIASEGYPFKHLWHGHKWGFAGRFGLGGTYHINDRVDACLELNLSGIADKFNSKYGHGSNIDWQFNALLGVIIHLGEKTKILPSIYKK